MEKPTVSHGTFVIERTYAATPERVFAAFSDPAKKRRWYIEGHNNDAETFEMDFRVGGFERSRFRFEAGAPLPAGTACANDSVYLDIVTNERVVLAYTMTVGYANGSGATATQGLASNGGAWSTVSYPPTAGWGRFGATVSTTVNLHAGYNVIRLAKGAPFFSGGTGFAELDYIQLS